MMNNWITTHNNGKPTPLESIPTLSRLGFEQSVCSLLDKPNHYIIAYFAHCESSEKLRLIVMVADQQNGDIYITSHNASTTDTIQTLAIRLPQITIFEREITERYGVTFQENPWPKPVRYPFDRHDTTQTIDNYPFYQMTSPDIHQVNVGPVHAGIIEPGVFRFLCDGEHILHLEIALGFQHRGIEHLILSTQSSLRRICLAEQIAGDTTMAHATAMTLIMEQGEHNPTIDSERIIALEMERIAMHIADTGALAADAAYQLGQTTSEALRTIVINTMQMWCGNRFGRTLVRPYGTNHHLTLEKIGVVKENLTQVAKRYKTLARNIFSTPTMLARLDDICPVTSQTALRHGAVGMAARSCAIERDCRMAMAFAPIDNFQIITENTGDLAARLRLRTKEVEQSYQIIITELKKLSSGWYETIPAPNYNTPLQPSALTFSLVEGFRGMICHAAITSDQGKINSYKIFDPSLRNWLMLAQSVRQGEISDFPLSNKSFNLSYCGCDL